MGLWVRRLFIGGSFTSGGHCPIDVGAEGLVDLSMAAD